MICNLIMWSSFNQECKAVIIECLESREQQAVANTEHCHGKKEICIWISALVISVQATVKYACKKIYLDSKKIEWDGGDALIVKEPILIEACYLSYAVTSSFSPAFSSFIDMNSKLNDCGGIDAISFVKMFVKYLGLVNPDAPIQKPLSQMIQFTKMDQSKICIDSFLTVYRKFYKIKFKTQQQQQQQQQAPEALLAERGKRRGARQRCYATDAVRCMLKAGPHSDMVASVAATKLCGEAVQAAAGIVSDAMQGLGQGVCVGIADLFYIRTHFVGPASKVQCAHCENTVDVVESVAFAGALGTCPLCEHPRCLECVSADIAASEMGGVVEHVECAHCKFATDSYY